MLRNAENQKEPGRHRRVPTSNAPRSAGWAAPQDIAAACAFLISEDAGYITGRILKTSATAGTLGKHHGTWGQVTFVTGAARSQGR